METKTVFSGQTSFQKVGNPAQFFRLPETAFRENKLSRRVSFPAPFQNSDQINGGSTGSLTHNKRVRLRLSDPQSTPQSWHTLTLAMSRPQTLGGVEKSASDTNTPKWVDLSHTSHTRGARFWYELNAQRDSRGRFSKLFAPKRGIHNARPWLFRKLLWDTYGPCAQSMEYLQEETTVGPTEFRG
jgi:hypothetical protein|tara:strand:+ start:1053 stop:1607 length:555 start_codon:yes stop_codon:yes gene_type:complete